jgi:hypothetical protein
MTIDPLAPRSVAPQLPPDEPPDDLPPDPGVSYPVPDPGTPYPVPGPAPTELPTDRRMSRPSGAAVAAPLKPGIA